MSNPQKTRSSMSVSRREFLRSSAVVGAGLVMAPTILAAENAGAADINVALIGAGTQGRVLLEQAVKIDGVKFKAVCDIWSYSQRYTSRRLKAYGHEVNVYEKYEEMLEKEKDLQAVIVATPDFMHAEHAIACLKAGKHVYCEKEMSNDLGKAKQMVLAARETGKLLQIGHQRRSNPRYIMAKEKLIDDAKLPGRITHIYGQWNRSTAASAPKGFPDKYEIEAAALQKYGYENMFQFRNWRMFKKYGGGPMEDLGSHQVDVFPWFINGKPKSVQASAGVDYWKEYELYDNILAIYEFTTEKGIVRAFYQTLTTSSARGYYESFMGDEGTLTISESPSQCRVYAEGHLPAKDGKHPWMPWVDKGYLIKVPDEAEKTEEPKSATDAIMSIYKSKPPTAFMFNIEVEETYHKDHIENFVNA
ncbi:MAG: Gfo/Idh/MocA family oxidoreductase, partial [Acidobacteria bacterium]|nr:Gfo/Idh/MocA family oxidoreductase [Acidobacteriota bacterium]